MDDKRGYLAIPVIKYRCIMKVALVSSHYLPFRKIESCVSSNMGIIKELFGSEEENLVYNVTLFIPGRQ